MTFGSEGKGISSGSSAGGTTSNFCFLSAMLLWIRVLARNAHDHTIVPCATDIHRAKRSGGASLQCLPKSATIDRHRLPGTECLALHYPLDVSVLRSFINYEPQA